MPVKVPQAYHSVLLWSLRLDRAKVVAWHRCLAHHTRSQGWTKAAASAVKRMHLALHMINYHARRPH